LIDMLDSGLKGAAHFRSLGAGYPVTCLTMAALCAAAALAKSRAIQFICLLGILLFVLSFIFEISTSSPM